jgi:hypothetical protein
VSLESPERMSADNEQIKAMEKEAITFTGYGGKVTSFNSTNILLDT